MPSYFITGASRGIGLAMAEALLKDKKNFVIASARNPGAAKPLQDLSSKFPKEQFSLVQLDISDPESIKRGATEASTLLPNGLDYLINNAGVSYQPLTSFEDIDHDLFSKEMYHNTVAPVQIGNAFLPLVRKSTEKKIVWVTSELGSISSAGNLPNLANVYSISKAALNMLARKWGATLKTEGITTILIHPGWVRTDIGDGINGWFAHRPDLIAGKYSAQESAENTLKVVQEAKLEDATSFYKYDGSIKPW